MLVSRTFAEFDFRNELFENQFVTLYAWQKHETVKNNIDRQKKKNKEAQLKAFVD